MSCPDPEVERARGTLRTLISLSMRSRCEIERQLTAQGCAVDLTRLLSDRIELEIKLRHVVSICRVLGLHPLEFFRFVFREPEQPSPFLRQIEAFLGPLKRP